MRYWLDDQLFNEILEALWGIEARLHNYQRSWGTVRRPWGFRVIEPRPRGAKRRPGAVTYLVYRVGLDSRIAGHRLAKALGARGYVISGLKDACARAYQYITLINPLNVKRQFNVDGVKAWLVWEGYSVWPGSHEYNMFKIKVDTHEPDMTCSNARQTQYIPGFFGPQRFGVERPNTHYIGLLYTNGMVGSIIREYRYRYPLEERRLPGSYERRAVELAEKTSNPWSIKVQRLTLEALQAYIYNRALSRTLPSVKDAAEHHITVSCDTGEVKVPAARLPSPKLARSRSKWAKTISEILAEEGLSWLNLHGLKPALRPLIYPVCKLKCTKNKESINLTFNIPRGAYATTLLTEITNINWLEYSKCHTK